MKTVLRFFGTILIVCGLIMLLIIASMDGDTQPRKVQFGIITNTGQTIVTDTGEIGGVPGWDSTKNSLNGLGILAIVGGGILWGGSFIVKPKS